MQNSLTLPSQAAWPYLEVPVDDAHSVQVVDGIQDLPDQGACIFLGVEPLLNDAVEKLSPRHSGKHNRIQRYEDVLLKMLYTSLNNGQGQAVTCQEKHTPT